MDQNIVLHADTFSSNFDDIVNSLICTELLCPAGDNTAYTFKDILQQLDRNDIMIAIIQEINAHGSRNHWSLMLRSDLYPGTQTVLAI